MQILELHKMGLSIRGIAPAVGLSPTTVQKYLAEWFTDGDTVYFSKKPGLDGKKRPSRRFDITERDAEIVRLEGRGWTISDIASEVGCSVGTVHRVVSRDSPYYRRKRERKEGKS